MLCRASSVEADLDQVWIGALGQDPLRDGQDPPLGNYRAVATTTSSPNDAAESGTGNPEPGNGKNCPENRRQREKMWKSFGRFKQRGIRRRNELRAAGNTKHPHFKILDGAPSKCRCGSQHRKNEVYLSHAGTGVTWTGTHKCASARFCSICSVQIAIENQREIDEALQNAVSMGWSFLFLTYTIPHSLENSLHDTVKQFASARKKFVAGGALTRFRKSIGYEGSVTRYEETYGINGLHPHIHEVIIINRFLPHEESAKIIKWYRERWITTCIDIGIIPNNRMKAFKKHGFDGEYTTIPDNISKYLAKHDWESKEDKYDFEQRAKKEIGEASEKQRNRLSYEVSSKDTKRPKLVEGRSMWDIFESAVLRNNDRDFGIWLEYMIAYSGKAVIRWSPLLAAKLKVRQKDEEAKVSEKEMNFPKIFEVPLSSYSKVVRNSLWYPVIVAVEKIVAEKDYTDLQHIADEYGLEFNAYVEKETGIRLYESVIGRRYLEEKQKRERWESEWEERRRARLIAERRERRRRKFEAEYLRRRRKREDEYRDEYRVSLLMRTAC